MAFEVDRVTTPARPRRAIVCSVLFLALTVLLARDLTRRRTSDPLGPRIAPEGWHVSFRAPRQFRWGGQTADVVVLLWRQATLQIFRIDARVADGPAELCAFLLHQVTGAPVTAPLAGARSAATHLGAHVAAECATPDGTATARTVVPQRKEAYAVLLLTRGAPIDDSLYRLFDLTCLSFEFAQ